MSVNWLNMMFGRSIWGKLSYWRVDSCWISEAGASRKVFGTKVLIIDEGLPWIIGCSSMILWSFICNISVLSWSSSLTDFDCEWDRSRTWSIDWPKFLFELNSLLVRIEDEFSHSPLNLSSLTPFIFVFINLESLLLFEDLFDSPSFLQTGVLMNF